MDGKQQLTFGWDIDAHRARDSRINRMGLPKSIMADDATVAEDKVRFLLHRLNHHAWGDRECYPAQETLAAEMGVDTKTIRRTLQACQRKGLVSVKRKKAGRLSCNHYAIEWEKIDQLGKRQPHPETVGATGQDARLVEGTDRTGPGTNRTLRPDQTDISTGPTGQYARQLTVVMGDCEEQPPPQARASGGGCLKMIWGRKVDEKELFDDGKIDVLFGQVVRCGFATEVDRERFAALVVNLRRQKVKPNADGKVERIGLLTAIIEGRVENKFVEAKANPRDWRNRALECDRDEARQILKRLEGIGSSTFVSRHVEEAVELADQEAELQRQAAELLEQYGGQR